MRALSKPEEKRQGENKAVRIEYLMSLSSPFGDGQ
jgi:hypothetical protein